MNERKNEGPNEQTVEPFAKVSLTHNERSVILKPYNVYTNLCRESPMLYACKRGFHLVKNETSRTSIFFITNSAFIAIVGVVVGV